MTSRVSRLAPSPTGALHLGNARTFMVNWALARQRGWRLIMRMEDLDGPRVKPEAVGETLDLLSWLGIDHDGDATCQSHSLTPYRDALRTLVDRGQIYPCSLTRGQIVKALSAPQEGSVPSRFPPELRPAGPPPRTVSSWDTNYRIMVPDEEIDVIDEFRGASRHRLMEEGDFVIWTRRGVPSYQLAVVVDDARQDVTDVVRGDDLLASAALQTFLYRRLGGEVPRWWHLPLVVGPDGRRLAKRHGDTRVQAYRDQGTPPERVIGLLGWWSGLVDERCELTARDFLDRFDLGRLPRDPIVFSPGDDAWLLTG